MHKKEEADSVLKLLSSTSTNYKICRFSERFSSLKTNDDKKRKSSTPISSTAAKSMRLSETKRLSLFKITFTVNLFIFVVVKINITQVKYYRKLFQKVVNGNNLILVSIYYNIIVFFKSFE